VKTDRFWYWLGFSARAALTAALLFGAALGYLLLTKLQPFRYMEL
jgi:hypothetical protein